MILRQLTYTYNLILFLNADEKRSGADPDYRLGYSFVALPLNRTLIDGFFTTVRLTETPQLVRDYRRDGYKRILHALQQDQRKYGRVPKWKEYIEFKRHQVTVDYTLNGFTKEEIEAEGEWLLLSKYIRTRSKRSRATRKMLEYLALSIWQEYSAMSHVTYQGLQSIYPYISLDNQSQSMRKRIREEGDLLTTTHIGRAAVMLVASLTEIQALFRFDEPGLVGRLQGVWQALLPIFGVEEFYDFRYKALLASLVTGENLA